MQRAHVWASVALLTAACTHAPAPRTPSPERVRELAPQVERLTERGAPKSEWDRLGPDGLYVLDQVASDARQPLERRQHALETLARLNPAQGAARLKSISGLTTESELLRSWTMMTLALLRGPAAVADLRPLLEDPSSIVRSEAAHAIAASGGDEARGALEDRLSHEEDPSVRESLQRSLSKLVP